MLNHNTVLVFGVNGDITSHIGLRLALEGYRLIALDRDPAKVRRIEREVEDVGGTLSSLIVDLTRGTWDVAFRSAAEQLREVSLIVNAPENGGAEQTLYDAFLAEYRQNDAVRRALPNLQLLIDVDVHPNRRGLASSSKLPGSARHIRIDAEQVDRTLHLDDAELNRRLAEGRVQHFSPALVANEILSLLTDPAYRNVSRIAFQVSGEDVLVTLHPFSANGASGHKQPASTIRRGSVLKTYLRETRHGKGVFAGRDIRKDELILENTGVVLNHQTEHSMQIGWDLHVEPDPPIRLINHSCEPNAGVRTNDRGFPDIIALRDIARGEEIFFDYAMTEFQHYNRERTEMEFSLECRCGSANCRGKLGYYSELPDALKEKYRGYLSDYLVQWEMQRAYHSASAR